MMLYQTRSLPCKCRKCIFRHFLTLVLFSLSESRSERAQLYQVGHLREAALSITEVSPAWTMKLDYIISRGPLQPTTFCDSKSTLSLAQFCPNGFFLGSFCFSTESFFHHTQNQVLLNRGVQLHIDEGLRS